MHYRDSKNNRNAIMAITAATIGPLAFLFVLWLQPDISPAFQRHAPLAAMAALLFLAASIGCSTWNLYGASRWATAGIAVTGFSLFALSLAGKWSAALTSDVILGGLLPISDAADYYAGALSLLHLGELTEWTTRRPLFALQLATLIGPAGATLPLAIGLMVALAAAGAALVVVTMARYFGLAPAIAGGSLLFVFFYPTIGTLMSENIGFTLGCCGFVLMWAAVTKEQPGLFMMGLMLMGLALMARAGAMLVLPMLCIYAGWRFRGRKRFSLLHTALALAVVVAAFAVNAIVVRGLGDPEGAAFSNFSYTLYGLASGGHGWTRVYRDFPEISSLPPAAQAQEAYRLAVEHILRHPLDLFIGIARTYNEFFINTRWFRFDGIGSYRIVYAIFALVGLYRLFRARRGHVESFIATGILGVWLSVPFVADGGTRIHAATVPFTAALVALGVATVLARFRPVAVPYPAAAAPSAGAGVVALIVLTTVASAPLLRATTPGETSPRDCPDGARATAFATAPGAFIKLVGKDRETATGPNTTSFERFSKGRMWHGVESSLADDVLGLALPARLGLSMAIPRGELHWVVSGPEVTLPGNHVACVQKKGGLSLLSRISSEVP